MNMRPFFPAEEVIDQENRVRVKYPKSIVEPLHPHSVPNPHFQDLHNNNIISDGLFEVLEDVHMIAVIGVDDMLKTSDTESLIYLRDGIIQRLIFLAPDTQDGDENISKEEYIRLTVLLLILDRLFWPFLPSAYFMLTHMVADRLATALDQESALADNWAGQECVILWICFIGTTLSSNNPRTRSVFVNAAVLVCRQLFTGPQQLVSEVQEGLGNVLGTAKLFGDTETGAFVADLHSECATLIE
jgi:hypothetical protein